MNCSLEAHKLLVCSTQFPGPRSETAGQILGGLSTSCKLCWRRAKPHPASHSGAATPQRGGRAPYSLCLMSRLILTPAAARGDGSPGEAGVSHLPRVVVLTPHVYSLVHVAV